MYGVRSLVVFRRRGGGERLTGPRGQSQGGWQALLLHGSPGSSMC